MTRTAVHTIGVVIPVYRGRLTLGGLVDEILGSDTEGTTADGHPFRIEEVLLVHDSGDDDSAELIRDLAERHELVRPIWLSRNFGQHAATLAGMASTASDWIVTMDEDGEHDPAAIPAMIDRAMTEQATVVYADPVNAAPHSRLRNIASHTTKTMFTALLSNGTQPRFSSFRLVLGEVGRSVAAYGGEGVYLDVALGWITQRFATCQVELRSGTARRSTYRLRSLLSHFWRLVLSSGTRPLRLVSLTGLLFAVLGACASVLVVVLRLTGRAEAAGWTSLSLIVLIGTGTTLFSLGLVAEYIGVTVRRALGKPAFLIVSDLADGPLGRRPVERE